MSKSKTPLYIAGATIIAVALGAYFYLSPDIYRTNMPAPAPQVTAPVVGTVPTVNQQPSLQPEPEPTYTPSEPELIAPPASLNGSDSALAELVNSISPELTAWLVPDEQIRKIVLTINLMADGKIPKKYQPLNFPMSKFQVVKEDGKIYPGADNYDRATQLVDAIETLNPTTVANYIRYWQPIADSAYGELGNSGNVIERLNQALTNVINAKPQPDNPELKQPSVFYVYADKNLENSSDLDKLLWRLGPNNANKIKNFARKLKAELQL